MRNNLPHLAMTVSSIIKLLRVCNDNNNNDTYGNENWRTY